MASRIFEYFVVCGIGPEIRTLDGNKGYEGTGVLYLPSLLDQYPPSDHSLSPPPPPQLPTVSFQLNSVFFWIMFRFIIIQLSFSALVVHLLSISHLMVIILGILGSCVNVPNWAGILVYDVSVLIDPTFSCSVVK